MGVTRNTVGHSRLEYRASTIVMLIVTRAELGYIAFDIQRNTVEIDNISPLLKINTEENKSLPTLPSAILYCV